MKAMLILLVDAGGRRSNVVVEVVTTVKWVSGNVQ